MASKPARKNTLDFQSNAGNILPRSVVTGVSNCYRTLFNGKFPLPPLKCPNSCVRGGDTASVQNRSLETVKNLIAVQLRNCVPSRFLPQLLSQTGLFSQSQQT